MRKLLFTLLGVVFLSAQLLAQTRTVSGKILDPNGNGVPNASVLLKGTSTGTTTVTDGSFSLSVPSSGKTLVISAVGMALQEVDITNKSDVIVRLKLEDRSLQEVVVIGYGTQRRKDLTGSVSTVKGGAIKDLPVQSFDQALSGRAAGVSVNLPNGVLNNPPVIRIRGVNSISLSSFPLIVIDGIPTFAGNVGGTASNNPLADINPSDIESIEILKDAAAAAIYGSRASAGVLLISTKKGRSGRTRVSYDGWAGWTKAFNLIEVLNAQEYTDLKNEGLTNAGTPPVPAPGTPARGFFTQTGADGKVIDTRWYDWVYQTGFQHNHSVNVSGASDKTQYFFSAGYSDQEGMLQGNTLKRLTTRLTVDQKVNNWLSLGGSANFSNSINKAPNTGSLPGQAFTIAGLGRLPIVLAPNVAPYNADGTYNINTVANTIGQGNNRTALSFYNPVYILKENKFSSESNRILANAYAQIKIINGLTFRSNYGIDYLYATNKEFRAAVHGDGVQFGGASQNTQQAFKRWNWQNLLTYDRSIAEDHNINVLVGNEQQYTFSEGWGADRRQQSDPFFDEFQGGYNQIVPSGNFFGENYLVSFFSRINYDYKKKYLLSINGRRDGYSAFATGKKYGNFGGVSAGWVISEENFIQNSKINETVSNLKLKASYGQVGNLNGINDYGFYSFFSSGLYGDQASLFYSQAGNPNLTWESSKKLDAGFEVGLWRRLNVDFTYYNNNIDNLILDNPQSPSAGIPGNSILTNIGRMVNKGIELTISGAVIQNRNITWNSSFNITTANNEVKELALGNSDIFPATSGLERPSIIRVGESIGSFYAVRTAGVNPATGQRVFVLRDGTLVQYNHAAPAASRWTKLDGSAAPRGADQASDGVIMGPALPKWFGGWDNTVRWQGFDLNILLFFSGGNYVYNGTKAGLRDQRNWNNAKEALTRWQKTGDVTNIPRVVFGDNVSNGSAIVISENVEKGDFIKARNIALGYTIPKKLTDRMGINSIRVYGQVQNAFTITKYTGFDPEVSTNGNSNGSPSVDRNTVPQARTIMVGLNVSF
jgi:TonB-dependent starch-binding outer membrane protein SusC